MTHWQGPGDFAVGPLTVPGSDACYRAASNMQAESALWGLQSPGEFDATGTAQERLRRRHLFRDVVNVVDVFGCLQSELVGSPDGDASGVGSLLQLFDDLLLLGDECFQVRNLLFQGGRRSGLSVGPRGQLHDHLFGPLHQRRGLLLVLDELVFPLLQLVACLPEGVALGFELGDFLLRIVKILFEPDDGDLGLSRLAPGLVALMASAAWTSTARSVFGSMSW